MTITDQPTALQPDSVEALAAEIVASWKAKEESRQYARARSVARHQLATIARQERDATPASWADRIAKAGLTGVAQTWKGAPVAPSLVVRQGSGFSIDAKGIWFTPERHARQFVCSPVVHVEGHRRFAALVGSKWKTVEVESPDRSVRQPEASSTAQQVVRSLAEAGARFGESIDRSKSPDSPDLVPAAKFAGTWLLGITPDGALCGPPTALLSDIRPVDGRPPTGERQQLGEVLTRQPRNGR